MAKKMKPVHPGEILREEFMTPLGLSMNKMAMALRVPVTRIADIVNERRGITADTALRFARYFRNSPAFWMNLQTRYDLEVAEDEIAAKVARVTRGDSWVPHSFGQRVRVLTFPASSFLHARFSGFSALPPAIHSIYRTYNFHLTATVIMW